MQHKFLQGVVFEILLHMEIGKIYTRKIVNCGYCGLDLNTTLTMLG